MYLTCSQLIIKVMKISWRCMESDVGIWNLDELYEDFWFVLKFFKMCLSIDCTVIVTDHIKEVLKQNKQDYDNKNFYWYLLRFDWNDVDEDGI